jgi:hypothetical protein
MRRKKTYIAAIMAAAIMTSVAVQTPVAVLADEDSDEDVKTQLSTPQILNIEGKTLSLSNIDSGVTKVKIKIDGEEKGTLPINNSSVDLSGLSFNEGKLYEISVQAVSDDESKENSGWSDSVKYVANVKPPEVGWSFAGQVYCKNKNSFKVNYKYYIYKGDELVKTDGGSDLGTGEAGAGVSDVMTDSGTYYIRAYFYNNSIYNVGEIWSDKVAFDYTIEKTLKVPKNIAFDGSTVTWNVEDENKEYIDDFSIQIEVYDSSNQSWSVVDTVSVSKQCREENAFELPIRMYEITSVELSNLDSDKTYRLKMCVQSGNAKVCGGSSWSDYVYYPEKPNTTENKTQQNNNEDDSNNTSTDETTSSSDSNEETTSSTTTTESQPTVGSSSGWSAIDSEISKVISQPVTTDAVRALNVKLSNSDFIPASALKAVASSNVILSANIANDTVINIDGSQIDDSAASYTRFTSEETPNGETSLIVNTAGKDVTKNITIFKKMKPEDIGKIITLYFIDENGNRIPFRVSYVYENGYAAFETPFVHANYVITVD